MGSCLSKLSESQGAPGHRPDTATMERNVTPGVDLNLIPGPPPPKDKMITTTALPGYFDLPAFVVRKKILGNLSSPVDKLNLIEALPSEGRMMNWEKTNLQFELIYPILMALRWPEPYSPRPFPFLLIEWKDVFNLCMVNSIFQRVIKKHFESLLLEDPDSFWRHSVHLDKLFQFLSSPANDDLGTTIPFFPVKVKLDFLGAEIGEHGNTNFAGLTDKEFQERMGALDKIGDRILNFSIRSDFDRPPVKFAEMLITCLEKMPNIKKLTVDYCKGYYGDDTADQRTGDLEELRRTLAVLPFPELPSLKTIHFEEDGFTDLTSFSLLKNKLLEGYGQHLSSLDLEAKYHCQDLRKALSLPRLSFLKITHDRHQKIEGFVRFLSTFQDCCALRKIRLSGLGGIGQKGFRSVMTILSDKFGGILEELEISLFDRFSHYSPGVFPPVVDKDNDGDNGVNWMEGLSFQKLKRLTGQQFPPSEEGWTVLLLFPAVEHLSLTHREGQQYSRMEFSFDKEAWIHSGAIWELLPFLDSISLKWNEPAGDGKWRAHSAKITRQRAMGMRNKAL